MLFVELAFVVAHVPRGSRRRGDSALVHRVFVGVYEADHVVGSREVWEVERRQPASGFDSGLQPPLEVRDQGRQLITARSSIEPADGDVDRVNGSAAEHLQQLVAMFLQPQAAIHFVRKIFGHVDAAVVSQKIRSVQQMDVQRMALDPLAAVQQPPQPPNVFCDFDAQRRFESMHRTHLIRDRADAADACGDVRHLLQLAASQQSLEQPRWLEDRELHLLDAVSHQPHEESSLAFDASQCFHFDESFLSHGDLRKRCVIRATTVREWCILW